MIHANATVLVVEDAPSVLNFVSAILRQEGCHVLEATNGPDALRLLQRRKEQIDLLVTDVHMEPLTGTEVADSVRRLHPSVQTLYISGVFPANPKVSFEVNNGMAFFLPKPFSMI
jgi:two-component system cell cycle sensor histidine kinase/response regulator CckA